MEIVEEKNVTRNTEEKSKHTIFGISIWRILAYFIIYSFAGYVIETIFGIITKGTWESRQSFLYGPFCAIYGLGAVIMIVSLQYFNKNNNTLFWGGFIIGSITEYIISLIGEMIFNTIWWDYSNMPLNLNGRICVFFSIFWGLLAIYLMTYVNPKVDKLINKMKEKISTKKLKIITTIVIVFLFIDCILTGIALKFFVVRMVYNNNLNVYEKEKYIKQYSEIYSNTELVEFINKFWSDEKMIKTFPNLKIQEVDNRIVYFDSLLPNIQPYYYKFDQTWRQELSERIKGNY